MGYLFFSLCLSHGNISSKRLFALGLSLYCHACCMLLLLPLKGLFGWLAFLSVYISVTSGAPFDVLAWKFQLTTHTSIYLISNAYLSHVKIQFWLRRCSSATGFSLFSRNCEREQTVQLTTTTCHWSQHAATAKQWP